MTHAIVTPAGFEDTWAGSLQLPRSRRIAGGIASDTLEPEGHQPSERGRAALAGRSCATVCRAVRALVALAPSRLRGEACDASGELAPAAPADGREGPPARLHNAGQTV